MRWLVLVPFLAIALIYGAFVLRSWEIERCENSGGKPVTYSIYSERFFEVGCVHE